MNLYAERITLKEASEILLENDLNPNEPTDYTIGLFKNNTLVATGSLYKNIIKLVAIKKEFQKENLLSIIITNLINELTRRKISKYFLYTKETEAKYFLSLGFSLIVSAKGVSYLENSFYPLKERLTDMYNNLNLNSTSTGSIVMNCNPITLGHLYLITEAAKKHQTLLVFLVEEDKSLFSYEVRKNLVIEATKHLENVIVLPSTKYLISEVTFPTYFLKDLSEASLIQMHLDAKIFNDYFVPIFKIDKRYVGSEETDKFTNEYNQVLKFYLKDKLEVIQRLKVNNVDVSASLVRKYFNLGEYEKIKELTPKTTYDFLMSDEGKKFKKWEIKY